ncbi:MAG: hypothetical protein K8S97_14975 [Anaerolineae bacterium]|nr:hypothetical protein [Anaerolineae bacterium]
MLRYTLHRPVKLIVALWLSLALVLSACTMSRSATETPAPAAATSAPAFVERPAYSPMVVTWSAGGDLHIWLSDSAFPRRIASGGVIRPFLARTGRIAYLRGPGGDPRSLWVIDGGGGNERQLIDAPSLPVNDSTRRIGQAVWSRDAHTIYFNTVTGDGIDTRSADDLWRVDADTGTAEQLLTDGEGGQITLSPHGTLIALATPGDYAQPGDPSGVPGQIALYDLQTRARIVIFEFPAVATGSEYRWYPDLTWLPDSSALRTAIPTSDLVYGDGAAETVLWTLPVDGEAGQIGTADADFFGLPRFSADGAWITFIQRRATLDQTALTLILAAGNGTQPIPYDTGEIGVLGVAAWSPGGAWFTYTNGDPGAMWIGGPGGSPLRFPGEDVAVHGVVWADMNTYIYLASGDAGYTLAFGLLDIPTDPQVIATVATYPAFEAVLP